MSTDALLALLERLAEAMRDTAGDVASLRRELAAHRTETLPAVQAYEAHLKALQAADIKVLTDAKHASANRMTAISNALTSKPALLLYGALAVALSRMVQPGPAPATSTSPEAIHGQAAE